MSRPDGLRVIEDLTALRALHGEAIGGAVAKVQHRIDAHARRFLERSPFLVLATAGGDGLDCSPRGDGAGFLRVLDDTTLLLPERPGNRRADSMANLLADPRVALLAMIPGMDETLRVNGRAWLVDDPELLGPSSVRGRAPHIGIWIHVEELFFHCPKAFIRSRLWDPAGHIERSEFPTLGKMVLDQISGRTLAEDDPQVAATDAALEQDSRDNLY